MRIVAGTLRGRKIEPPLSLTTRPMMDRIRQALFNIIEHHEWGTNIADALSGSIVLDAFCGTGALAYEALSRGARYAFLFDKEREALQIATQNAATLGLKEKCQIALADALKPPKTKQACKLVFLAPPYKKGLILPALEAFDQAGWISEHALIVAETAKQEDLATPEGFTIELSRSYGDTMLHFFTR